MYVLHHDKMDIKSKIEIVFCIACSGQYSPGYCETKIGYLVIASLLIKNMHCEK